MEVTNQKFDFTKHLASDFREEALSDGNLPGQASETRLRHDTGKQSCLLSILF